MPTQNRPRKQQAPLRRAKPASLPAMAAATAALTRNQQDDQGTSANSVHDNRAVDRSDALPPPRSPLRSSSASNISKNNSAQLSPRDAMFIDFACSRVRRHVDLSGWSIAGSALQLLRTASNGVTTLEKLTLDGCERVTVTGGLSCLSAVSCSALTSVSLERCQGLSAESVVHIPTALTELKLAYCEWVDDQCVRALAKRCPVLASVSLRHCKRVTDYGVAAFPDASVKPALTFLDISYCTKVTDVGVLVLFTKASKLHTLLAAGLPLLEGVNLQGMARTGNCLETLDFSDSSRLRAMALRHLIHVYANARLMDLNLSGCALVTDDVLVALGRCCPNLLTLRLAACALVSDAGVQRLVEFVPCANEDTADFVASDGDTPRCVKLRMLELTGCFQLTDAALSAVGRACADLEVLLLDGVRRLTGVGLRVVTERCKRLRTLCWSGVLVRSTKATTASPDEGTSSGFFSIPRLDRAVLSALSVAAHLHTLHIGSTQCDADALCLLLARVGGHLRDVDVTAIATDAICESIGAACRALRALRLSRSRYFSERSFLCVARNCVELHALDLESCEQIRDANIVTLSEHCVQLERLVLANDWQVTDASIELLGARCPRLLTLNVRHCPEVTLPALQRLAQSNNCVDVSRDGLTPKHANVVKWLRRHNTKRSAARRITRWLKQRLHDRYYAKQTLEQALRCIKRRKRCAVRIQRCIRRFLVQCRHLALIEQVKRERDERVATAWYAVRNFCVVCKHLRAFLRRWLAARRLRLLREAERVRIERDQAATAIQKIVRGFLGRRRAHAARIAAALERQRRTAAATAIQCVCRGYLVCSSATLHDACRAREVSVFSTILELEQRECAALQLQRIVRGFVGRRHSRYRAAFVERLRLLRERAARRVQRAYRAHLARVQLQRFVFRTATQLQRVFRGHHGRQCARTIVLQRSYALEPRILMLLPRSIFTRSFAVQWKRKRDAAVIVATNIQCFYRGYIGRVRYRVTHALARQAWFTHDRSARTLQHFFRSIVILKRLARFQAHLHLRHCSATKIQATWRMWLGKVQALARSLRADRVRRHAALLELLASAPRDARVQLYFLQLGAVATIVRTYRTSLFARGWQAPSHVRFLHSCATRIQALVRGHFGRQYARWYCAALVYAAQVVQRVWRGRVGRKIWRQFVTERAQRLREQEEDDRAARVSRKLSSQYALDAYEKDTRHARVLQGWYRTLRNRQVFKQARDVRDKAFEMCATEKLTRVFTMSTESVVFQSRVWRDCMEQKEALLEMEEAACVTLEAEIAALKTACRTAHVAAAQAAAEHSALVTHMRDVARTKKQLGAVTAQVKTRVKPFAVQAKKLTKQSARVHVTNKQLQHELRALDQGIAALHRHLHAVLPYEPLLLASDVAHVLSLLELPDGCQSLVADELAALRESSMERSWLLVLQLVLLVLLSCAYANAQVVITAPDKGDELERRAYVEAQSELADTIRRRDPNATIDIDVYTVREPTQYVIGLLLDPCRDHAPDCCSDRFGEPAYTTAALSAKEKISLLDESGAPLDVSASRLSDRPSRFDADCYVDASLTPFRLTKTLYADKLVVSKNYSSAAGCVGRLRALAPMQAVTMPPCWDHNDTVNALAPCMGWDGRRKDNCVAVAYMQTAYIVQCFGAFALANHCGTFLELHEPGSEVIVSQTRLLGEYPSGFRTTTLPLTFRGDRTRTVCAGTYELWWVQRTRYNFIVQKKKTFTVVAPPCDFDFATNTYKNYHVKAATA